MFPTKKRKGGKKNGKEKYQVAIPSNRVNVSYSQLGISPKEVDIKSRNPLKSGQCFLLTPCLKAGIFHVWPSSQSPQIGSMFPTLFNQYN